MNLHRFAIAAAIAAALGTPALAATTDPTAPRVDAGGFIDAVRGHTLRVMRADGGFTWLYVDQRGRATRQGYTAANDPLGGMGNLQAQSGQVCEHWVDDAMYMKPTACFTVERTGTGFRYLDADGREVAQVLVIAGYAMN
jgi:hypothetical protein